MAKETGAPSVPGADVSGLFLRGTVVKRTKREVRLRKSGETKEIKSYAVLAGAAIYTLDVWEARPIFEVNQAVEVAVSVRSVANGRTNLGLTDGREESF